MLCRLLVYYLVVIFRKLLDLNLNSPTHESRYIEVFVIVLVAIGLFEVATLRTGINEEELVLIDSSLLFFAQLGLVHGARSFLILGDFGFKTKACGFGLWFL